MTDTVVQLGILSPYCSGGACLLYFLFIIAAASRVSSRENQAWLLMKAACTYLTWQVQNRNDVKQSLLHSGFYINVKHGFCNMQNTKNRGERIRGKGLNPLAYTILGRAASASGFIPRIGFASGSNPGDRIRGRIDLAVTPALVTA